MKQNMFRENTQSNIVKMVVILALLLFNIKPLEAARHLDVKKSKLGTMESISHYRALPPSSNPCTYIPSWIHVDMPCCSGRGSTSVHQRFFFFDVAQFGPKLFEIGPDMGPKWSKIKPDMDRNTYRFKKKKNVNFKFIFYLDLVSNF